jgi:peptide chain release factor subunit 1
VLSVHVDTSPARIAGQAYLLAFRDGIKSLREALPEAEREALEVAASRAEAYLAQMPRLGGPRLALFVAPTGGYFHAVPVPQLPPEGVSWGAAPRLEPLQEALDDLERVAVLLFDQERARIFTVYLGAIETRRVVEDEVPGKQATGGWFGLAQTRYERHREDLVLRHAARAVQALAALGRALPFDRLLIGGPPEALALLRRRLPRPLRARLAGTIDLELFASDADVLQAALRAAAAIERRVEAAQLDELFDAATAARASLGVDETLAALWEGRVHVLLAADGCSAAGSECTRCGRLVAGSGERCPVCGGPAVAVPDLLEAAVRAAVAQGARAEIVGGEAAARLRERGGLAAWTRY